MPLPVPDGQKTESNSLECAREGGKGKRKRKPFADDKYKPIFRGGVVGFFAYPLGGRLLLIFAETIGVYLKFDLTAVLLHFFNGRG